MNFGEKIFLGVLQTVSWCLGATVMIALSYAFYQIATGNIHGTASFEFQVLVYILFKIQKGAQKAPYFFNPIFNNS